MPGVVVPAGDSKLLSADFPGGGCFVGSRDSTGKAARCAEEIE